LGVSGEAPIGKIICTRVYDVFKILSLKTAGPEKFKSIGKLTVT
jgi:hypothetical protein